MKLIMENWRKYVDEGIRDISPSPDDDPNVGQYLAKDILKNEKQFRKYFAPFDLPIDVHIFNVGELIHGLDMPFTPSTRKGTQRVGFVVVGKNKIQQILSLIRHAGEKSGDRKWYRWDKALRSQYVILKRIYDIWKNARKDALTVLLSSPAAVEAFDSGYGWLLHDVAGHKVDKAFDVLSEFAYLLSFFVPGSKHREGEVLRRITLKYLSGHTAVQFRQELQKDLNEITPGVDLRSDASASIYAYYLLKKVLPPSLEKFLTPGEIKTIHEVFRKVGEELKGHMMIAVQ